MNEYRFQHLPILVREVLREILGIFLVAITASTVLVLLLGVGTHLLEHGVDVALLMRVLPYMVPSMLPFTLPASLLMAVTSVFGRMSVHHELTAVKAAGINTLRLMIAPFVLAILMSGMTFILSNQIVPWAAAKMHGALLSHVEQMIMHQLRTSHRAEYPPANIRFTVADMKGDWMIRPLIQQQSGKTERTVFASFARLEVDPDHQLGRLQLHDAVIESGDEDRIYLNGAHSFSIPIPISREAMSPRFVGMRQIRKNITEEQKSIHEQRPQLSADSADVRDHAHWTIHYAKERLRKYETEIHTRYALACSCFCFVLLGCPLAARFSRGELGSDLLCCFLPMTAAYYVIVFGTIDQCREGNLNPVWAMWTGNALMSLLGAKMLHRQVSR